MNSLRNIAHVVVNVKKHSMLYTSSIMLKFFFRSYNNYRVNRTKEYLCYFHYEIIVNDFSQIDGIDTTKYYDELLFRQMFNLLKVKPVKMILCCICCMEVVNIYCHQYRLHLFCFVMWR